MWLENFVPTQDTTHLYIFYGVSGLNALIALILIIVGCVLNNKTPGQSMNFFIAIGSIMTLSTVIIRGMNFDVDVNELEDTWIDLSCKYYPALLCYGLMFWIAGLLLRVTSILNFHKKTREYKELQPHREEWKPNAVMMLLILINAGGVLCWIFLFPMKVDKDENGVFKCIDQNNSVEAAKWWRIGYSVFFAALLILSFCLVWPAVAIGSKTSSSIEIDNITVAVNNFILCSAAGALVYFLFDLGDFLIYIIIGGLFNWAAFLTLVLLLISNIVVAGRRKESNNTEDEDD